MKQLRGLIVALMLLMPCAAAQAQNCNFTVGYTDFGTISSIRTEPEDVVGAVSIYCNGYTTPMVRMCLNIGLADQRQMVGPSVDKISYNLYVDPDHVSIWGSVTAPSTSPLILDLPVHPSGNIWAQEPFYGRIPPNQNISNGQYSMTFSAAQTYFVYVGYSGTPPDCKTASAPYKTAAFEVTANVGIDCDITATPMQFPDAGLLAQPLLATSSVTVQCTQGAGYYIELDGGSTVGGTLVQRKLERAGSADTVDYQLYTNSQRTSIWGDGTRGTRRLAIVANGLQQTFTVYGLVPAQQSKPAGKYSDTVTATVSF
jgi:spore coat protein U-like protein